jgi:UDP-N-acetylmuramoylalanine-D-glutamate ligase
MAGRVDIQKQEAAPRPPLVAESQWKRKLIHPGSELIPVNDHAPLIAIVPHLAGDHLDRHTDFHRFLAKVGQLGGDHGALIELDERHCVRGVGIEAGGSFVDGRERVYFSLATKCIQCSSFVAAVGTNVARRKDLEIAVRADLTHQ